MEGHDKFFTALWRVPHAHFQIRSGATGSNSIKIPSVLRQ